ncbi:MAG TPA: APC family permease [Candidatus Kapabacteria bacterium]|nr:APC family permease [Candidatus Kapabacteria bacterium]
MANGEPELQIPQTLWEKVQHKILGPKRDVRDPSLHHKISLIALLAWVGLGADGLSSSSYGPEEAYRALAGHTYIAILLVFATAATVFIISYAYSRIIEHFPHGGGGYVVATSLLGDYGGVVSGCALLVDYILTITVSIASGGDAVFSLLPYEWAIYKLPVELIAIVLLTLLNIRGVKESVTALMPIFLTFIVAHIILIVGGAIYYMADFPVVAAATRTGFSQGMTELGALGIFLLFLRSYSMGAGTYTGIEAVSNGIGIMREPKVETGKRTMAFMAVSLALTAGGLLLCYMLADVHPVEGQTLNAVLAEKFAGSFTIAGIPVGTGFVLVTIFSEGILLFVAAQTGFIDGPRIMANMATDAWLPRRFASLSDRLTMQNGIILMGIAALLCMLYTEGHIGILVVMYSINVFITFSLSETGMSRFWIKHRKTDKTWKRHLMVHGVGLVLCVSILMVMLFEKFVEGGWITLAITCLCIGLCVIIRNHYRKINMRVAEIDRTLKDIPIIEAANVPEFDGSKPTAAILVTGYDGLGIHILLTVLRLFPKIYYNFVFISVGVIDSAFFKDDNRVNELETEKQNMLQQYVNLANQLGFPARYSYRLGTDVSHEAAELCLDVAQQYPRVMFFAGELLFSEPKWYDRILHNERAHSIQRQVRLAGLPMVIFPILLRRGETKKQKVAA